MSDQIEVFSFKWYDVITDTSKLSPSKRERFAIEELGFKPIEGTKEVVNRSSLDEHGRYQPITPG